MSGILEEIRTVLSFGMMGAGLVLVTTGVAALYRFKSFPLRLLTGSCTDTAGLLLLCLGVVVLRGWDAFSLKVCLIALIALLIHPVITATLAKGHRDSQ